MARPKKNIEVPGDIPAPKVETATPTIEPPISPQPVIASPEIRHRYTGKEGNWVLTPIGWQWLEE